MKYPILALLVLTAVLGAEPGQRKQVTVPTKTLDKYVGSYALPGVVIKVTRETTHLFFQENDKPRKEIFAENDFQFYSKSSDDTITFQGIAKDGKAIILMIHQDGKDIPAARVQ